MKNSTDDRMKELYANTFNGIHASDAYSRKVINMTETTKKGIRTSTRVIFTAVAAAVLLIAGGAIVSANRGYNGVYDTITINGTEIEARFGSLYNEHWYQLFAEKDGTYYNAWIHGDYDPDVNTLILEDRGDYVIGSIDAQPVLNLYDDIENASYAEIIETEDSPTLVTTFTNKQGAEDHMYINLSGDADDGEKNGVVNTSALIGDTFNHTYTVAPNGAVVEVIKSDIEDPVLEKYWGVLWGYEDISILRDSDVNGEP